MNQFLFGNDPRQIKYEMLRAHYVDGLTVAAAAKLFGLSRQSFYQTAAAFSHAGLAGLAGKKRGPKRPHKLTPEVASFLFRRRLSGKRLSCAVLAEEVREAFGVSLHPHTIQRLLKRSPTPVPSNQA
jgi:transposase